METVVLTSSSLDEDLEAIARSTYEVDLIAIDGTTFGERRTLAPPTSENHVTWPIDRAVTLHGFRVWQDGGLIHTEFFDPEVMRRHDDFTLIVPLAI